MQRRGTTTPMSLPKNEPFCGSKPMVSQDGAYTRRSVSTLSR